MKIDQFGTVVLSVLVAVASMFSAPPVADAQSGPMGDEDDMEAADDVDADAHEEMLELSARGNELYENGDYEEAAEIYRQAYELSPQPILLKNQMITRYLLEQCEEAIELGERFLAESEPDQRDRRDAEAVFGECSLDLAREALAAEQWTRTDEWLEHGAPYFERAGVAEEAAEVRNELEERRHDEPTIDPPDDEDEPVDEPGMSGRQIGGWAAVGGGIATLIGTGIWHGTWESRLNHAKDSGDTDALEQMEEMWPRVRVAIPTLYTLGALSTIGGAALLMWPSLFGADEQAASLRIGIGADGPSVGISGSF